jgi:HSP20 family protein
MSFRRKKKEFDITDPWDLMEYFDRIFEEMQREFFKDLPFGEQRGEQRFGPIIYGYSITIGPDGKPIIREFGTVPKKVGEKPIIEREPLVDINETSDEIIVTAETPGVKKEEIKIHATEKELEIKAGDKFYKKIDLPSEVNPDETKATYNNGVLEIRMKKQKKELKGREIQVL